MRSFQMNKALRYGRLIFAFIIGILSISAFAGLFYPIKIFDIQITALIQKLLVNFSWTAAALFFILTVTTLIFGRIYCSTLCPFGLLQEFLMLIFRRKTPFQPNKPYKYFLAAIVFGTLIGGTAWLIRLTDPYSLFGSTLSGAWLGIGLSTIVAIITYFTEELSVLTSVRLEPFWAYFPNIVFLRFTLKTTNVLPVVCVPKIVQPEASTSKTKPSITISLILNNLLKKEALFRKTYIYTSINSEQKQIVLCF